MPVQQTFGDAMPNGWVGRQLPRLFRQTGLTDISVSPIVNLGEPAMFQAMIRSHVDRLRADNVLTASQAGDWWHALQRQVADGHFLAGAVIFVVAATRPMAGPANKAAARRRAAGPSSASAVSKTEHPRLVVDGELADLATGA